MSEELKPCPFCGGKARIVEATSYGVCAECQDCNCRTGLYGAREQAIIDWNRRVQQPNEPLTLEHVDCKTCQFEDRNPDEEPCQHCKGAYANIYAHKPEAGEKE